MKKIQKTIAAISVFAVMFTSVGSISSAAYAAEENGTDQPAVVQEENGTEQLDETTPAGPTDPTAGDNQNGTGEDGGQDGSGEDGSQDTPEQPELKSGAVMDDNGNWRYYDIVEDEEGNQSSVARLGTGWVKENGVRVYYLKKGILAKGWQTISNNKYHFVNSSTLAPKMHTGYTVLGSTPYYFSTVKTSSTYGKMRTGAIKNSNGSLLYYAKSTGVLKTGWVAYDKHAYYMYKSASAKKGAKKGRRAYNYKVNRNITIGSAGRIGGTRGKALYYGIKALDKNGWTLRSAYTFSYKLRYKNRPYRPKTVAQGAVYGFTNHYGNCFVMNCCFHVMADLMGYNVRQVKSSVGPWRAPHSWLEIKQDGKWWVYDANFRNETGRNGFKIYYGKKGTWRYNRSRNYIPKY